MIARNSTAIVGVVFSLIACSGTDFSGSSLRNHSDKSSADGKAIVDQSASEEPSVTTNGEDKSTTTFRPGSGNRDSAFDKAASIANDITGAWLTMEPGVTEVQPAIEIKEGDPARELLRLPIAAPSLLQGALFQKLGLFYRYESDDGETLGFLPSEELIFENDNLVLTKARPGIYQLGMLSPKENEAKARKIKLPILSWSAGPGRDDGSVLLSAKLMNDVEKLKAFVVYEKTPSFEKCPAERSDDGEVWKIDLSEAEDDSEEEKLLTDIRQSSKTYLGCIYNKLGRLAPVSDEERSTDVKEPNGNVFGKVDDGSIDGLVASVYGIPDSTKKLPDFDELDEPLVRLMMKKVDVPKRDFEEGFPGFDRLFEWFAMKIEGTLKLDKPCKCIFRLSSDDGSKLYVGRQLVVDNDGEHYFETETGSIELDAGSHPLRLEYYQGPRWKIGLVLEVDVTGTGRRFRVVPSDMLARP